MKAHKVAGKTYVIKPDHRDGTPVKSQWTIKRTQELDAFRLAITSGWIVGTFAWGLHINEDKTMYLGKAAMKPGPPTDLFLAVFDLGHTCHGYPADHARSQREKPPSSVRKEWLDKGHLRPAVLRKIGRGQRCSL